MRLPAFKANDIVGSLRDCTILAGAGISVPPPTCLPNAAQLSGYVFDLLTGSDHILLNASECSSLRKDVQEIRLEIFLEILAAEIFPATAFQVFEILRMAVPNSNHLAIAALAPRAVVTTNQDLLLEDAQVRLAKYAVSSAQAPEVLHLHGRCDDVGSITTIISQYLAGLEQSVHTRFIDAVSGARVVVLGYSGRDRDVMPTLLDAKPTFVRWVLHTPPNVPPEQALLEIAPELAHARKVLGERLDITCADTAPWLQAQLNTDERHRVAAVASRIVHQPLAIPPSVDTAFRRISVQRRNRAIARLLEHFGKYQAAWKMYQALARESEEVSSELLLSLGRTTSRVAGHEAGRKVLSSLLGRADIGPEIQAHALLSSIDALRNTSRYTQAKRALEELDTLIEELRGKKAYWHLHGWSLIARAGIDRLEGRVRDAFGLYVRAQHAFSEARDIDGVIDAGTWKAESALMLGKTKKAIAICDEALRDAAAYGKALVKAWPRYVQGECLALSGWCNAALSLADEAQALFEANDNIQGPLWSLILKSDCLRQISLKQASVVRGQLRLRARAHAFPHVRLRLLLEEAEFARAESNWLRAKQAIASARALLRRASFTEQPQLILAHTLLVEAECARDRSHPSAVGLLRRARAAYNRIGAKGFVARTEVALLLARASRLRTSQLLAACERECYGNEIVRLKKGNPRRREYYPIHFA